MTALSTHAPRPDPRLPVLYLGFAHFAFLAALLAIAADPAAVAGFFYHPRLVAVTHLVTLGWISASILGAVYMLGPMVLGAPMPARSSDYGAFAGYTIGTLGMVVHFWIDEPRGMAWSAGFVLTALAWVGWRFLRALARSKLAGEAKIHFRLAFANILLAGLLGLLAGIDKFHDVLDGYVLDNVFAHAHLAALGWATMMVMGAGHRLLPMLLPAALPRGWTVWGSALLLEVGVLGLAASWLSGAGAAPLAVLCCLGGIGLFFSRVVWMLGNRRPSPPRLERPDRGTLQSLCALGCLFAATALGVALAVGPEGLWRLPAATAYGVVGLVGFLAQIIVGVGARLVPLYAFLSATDLHTRDRPPPPPHALAARPILSLVLSAWLLGVPGLTAGLAFGRLELLRGSALLLAVATLLNAREEIRILRLYRRSVL